MTARHQGTLTLYAAQWISLQSSPNCQMTATPVRMKFSPTCASYFQTVLSTIPCQHLHKDRLVSSSRGTLNDAWRNFISRRQNLPVALVLSELFSSCWGDHTVTLLFLCLLSNCNIVIHDIGDKWLKVNVFNTDNLMGCCQRKDSSVRWGLEIELKWSVFIYRTTSSIRRQSSRPWPGLG